MKNLICLLTLLYVPIAMAYKLDDEIILDTVYDQYVSDSDPRIGGIMFTSKYDLGSYITIEYSGTDGKLIADSLVNVFDKNHIHYTSEENKSISFRKVILILMQNGSDKN